jgi:hypothetical protein
MVEEQIKVVVLIVHGHPFLSGHKAKPCPQF